MKINRTLFLCLIIALTAIDTFTQTKPKVDDNSSTEFLGTTVEGFYRNGFFGFSLSFPKSWTALSRERITQSVEIGQDILNSQDEKNTGVIDEAAQREILVLVITEKTDATEKTASLSIGVRKQPSARITSEMVINATKTLLIGNLSKLTKDTQKVKLGGEVFSVIELQNNWKGEYIYQKLFTTMRKGYSLTFVMTYKKSESAQAMENIMQSLTFSNL